MPFHPVDRYRKEHTIQGWASNQLFVLMIVATVNEIFPWMSPSPNLPVQYRSSEGLWEGAQ